MKRLAWFDRLVLASILALIAAISSILIQGNQVPTRGENFSWQGRKIGVRDNYFTLSFNRPIDRSDVETSLVIDPPLPGKISWSGDRLTYTLTELPIYGKKYQVKLPIAQGEDFIGEFYSHDRAFAYIGVNQEERGRLIVCNIIQGPNNVTELKKTILTPGDLVVTDFQIYPRGDRILFSAFDRSDLGRDTPKQQLYTITTGLNHDENSQNLPSGRIERFLDAKTYQNLRFNLSDNGKTLIVQRINHGNPGDASLWVISDDRQSRPLGIQGDNFLLSPDGKKAVVSQTGGLAVIPLDVQGGKPQFLPTYEKILAFSRDGRQKLMVKSEPDNQRSLFLLNDRGESRLLLRTANPIISCEFEPRQEKTLYCLKSDLVMGSDGKVKEEPFLGIIELETGKMIPLLALPNYRDVQMSMSPDGVALLFDQLATIPFGVGNDLVTGEGSSIADGRLWLLPLPDQFSPNSIPKILPQELNAGFKPRWLP
ncbi:Ig-like domain-containing protein [Microcystis aeruginosa CS-564/01]|uniref:Ig-like domain-containing protein n=1 Tax=Microcystis aeruginosa TaxID=1126 RepID=UPI00233116C6|nr:Ig-like domain-containing protein [Microcystis aeruginosa]MDB9426805.1 Ig-like domain-containing protein [Microcystis aeruginosa CS-564/01]